MKRNAPDSEIREVLAFSEAYEIQDYWNSKYQEHYQTQLESSDEIGRHGLLAELLTHFVGEGPILDAGCGTGILSGLLDTDRMEYVGVDIATRPLKIARLKRTRRGVSFVHSRIEDFVASRRYRAVVFNEVLYYLDLEVALSRARQWTGRRGWLLASVFEFPQGLDVVNKLRQQLDVKLDLVVRNESKNLAWRVVATRLK